MNLTAGDLLIVFLIEGTLVSFFLYTILFLRKSFPDGKPARAKAIPRKKRSLDESVLKDLLQESEAVSRDLGQHLQEKREIITRLTASLDAKIRDLSELLEKANEIRPGGESETPGSRGGNAQVVALARSGFPVCDIARQIGRSKEEVQLILDLEKMAVN